MDTPEKFDLFFALRDDIHNYFGYAEDWHIIPMADHRSYLWSIDGGYVNYHEDFQPAEKLTEIQTDRIYSRDDSSGIYRGEEYTMIRVYIRGGYALKIFDNKMEKPGI